MNIRIFYKGEPLLSNYKRFWNIIAMNAAGIVLNAPFPLIMIRNVIL